MTRIIIFEVRDSYKPLFAITGKGGDKPKYRVAGVDLLSRTSLKENMDFP